MHLSKVTVRGFRAAAEKDLICEFPGRFSLLIGGNNAGKTTVSDAIYLAHKHTFPQLTRPTAATLGRLGQRDVLIEYEFDPADEAVRTLGHSLIAQGLPAPTWQRQLERNLGRV